MMRTHTKFCGLAACQTAAIAAIAGTAVILGQGLVFGRGGGHGGGGHAAGHHGGPHPGGHHAGAHHAPHHEGGHAAAQRSARAHEVRNHLAKHSNNLHRRPIGPQHHQNGHHQHSNINNHNNHNTYNNFTRNGYANGLGYGNGLGYANGLGYGYGNRYWGWSSWPYLNNWLGTGLGSPYYYDYGAGGNVAYDESGVNVDGQGLVSTDDYSQQAADLADSGQDPDQDQQLADNSQPAANQPGTEALASNSQPVSAGPTPDAEANEQATEEAKWAPLGVFALDRNNSQVEDLRSLFQLAVNKQGIISGTAFYTDNDKTEPIYGAIDKKTQKVAFRVGDQPKTVYETGLFNLTQSETPVLVHADGKLQTELLVHLHPPKEGDSKADEPKSGPAVESTSSNGHGARLPARS